MGGNNDFPPKFFGLAGLKNFVEEHFCAVFPKTFGSKKVCR